MKMNLAGISIPMLVLISIWIIVILSIIIFKYKNRQNVHLMDTERRKGDRRSSKSTTPTTDELQVNQEKDNNNTEKRVEDDRRENSDWKSEYQVIREQIENETNKEDL